MRIPANQKLVAINAIKKGDKSVANIANELSVARKTVYSWLNRHKLTPLRIRGKALEDRYLKGLLHPRYKNKDKAIIKLVVTYPEWSIRQIRAHLNNQGLDISYSAIYSCLKRYNCTRFERRCNLKRLWSGPGRLSSDIKLSIVNNCLSGEKSISEVAREYQVARKTVYSWLNTYNKASKDEVSGIKIFEEKYVKGSFHPRSLTPDIEHRLLNLVLNHPELSIHKLSDTVGISSFSIWKILKRHKLTSYQSRYLYANENKEMLLPVKPTKTNESMNGTIWETFTPNLAPAPPPVKPNLRKTPSVKHYLILFFFSFTASIIGFYLANTYLGFEGITAKIGASFTLLSLFFGMCFFLYSLKYYLSLFIILSNSRNTLTGKVNNKSIIERLFGVEVTIEEEVENENLPINKHGLVYDVSGIQLERMPFVSIHVATYNEKRVINRLLTAATSMDYPNYEVIIADDSNDETVTLIEEFVSEWNKSHGQNHLPAGRHGPLIKISRRESRDGYKGGALREALKITDPRAEFILIFDADFIPYPDSITQFLKYFKHTAGSLDFGMGQRISTDKKQINTDLRGSASHLRESVSNIAAVQGYQWHVLNKSENWITRGVRSEYAGSYVIERSGAEVYGGLKQISGSVYMIRRDVLQSIGWGTSITEDFELTLRLYEKGWKVVYTPYIQAPAEAVSTLKRLIRQRMRWAEGHSFNIKRMFKKLMWGSWAESTQGIIDTSSRNPSYAKASAGRQESSIKYKVSSIKYETQAASIPNTKYLISNTGNKDKVFIPSPLTFAEKLELLYLTPYYLQAAFFILGTISWLISETVFRVRLPFWTEVWGWSLVLTNLFALPLMNLVGLFMEESEEKDYAGLLSFIVLSYIVAPFQAYAAIKGFLEDREGPWFRTPKTGRITDIFVPGRFVRIFSGLFGRPQIGVASSVTEAIYKGQGIAASLILPQADNKYLALLNYPSVRTLNPFKLSRNKRRKVANIFLVALSSISVIVSSLTPYVAVREVAYASSFIAAKTKNNSNNRQDESKDKKFLGLEEMRQPILKRAKTDKGVFDYVFHTEPRVKASFDKYELDLELTGINGNMLSRDTNAKRDDSLFIYEDIRAGIDARMKYLGNGFASELKLKKNVSVRNIEFSIRTNLNARIIDNEVLFFDSKKENIEVFRIGKPYMYEESNPQNESKNIRYSLSKSFDGWKLKKTLSPDASKWLNDPERSYPVILDPTVNSVVQTSIDDTTDSRWESPARKVAYMPNATGGAAWYATHTDGGAVHLEKCLVSAGCESTTDWTSVSTQLDTTETDADNRNSTVWKHNDLLYIAWFDNSGDKYQFTSINTASSDAQGSICIGSDQGSAIDVYNTIAVASDGDYAYVALVERGTGDGANDLEGIFRVATSGCSETDIITGSNIDQNDAVEVITKGDDAYFLFNDGTGLRMSVYVDDGSPGWDSANHDVNGGTADNDNTDLSAVTDGTDIWVFQRDGTTGDSELYKCSSCSASSPSFSALTDPWSAGNFTSSGDVGLSYLSSANEIMAVMVDDQTGAANFHIRSKKSNADTISWQSEFEFDISSQNIAMNYLTMTAIAPTSDQIAVVFQDATNSEFEFSTVPENIYLLIAFLPLFIYGRYLSGKKKTLNLQSTT